MQQQQQQQQAPHQGYGYPVPNQQFGQQRMAEVEGNQRNRAQLIVGIDFVRDMFRLKPKCLALFADICFQGTTFSGVAFAFATNTEAKEDIIVEWPGTGTQTKQKVSCHSPQPGGRAAH